MGIRIRAKGIIIFLFLLFVVAGYSQNTVGLLSYDSKKAFAGYNLFYPHNQPNVYLMNNCGQLVNTWTDAADFRPGNTAYLLKNGNLLKTKRSNFFLSDSIWAGGGGALVEIRDWNNNLVWRFEQNSPDRRIHHDIRPMPNGNILMISWELKTSEAAIEAGRNPATIDKNRMWPDYILEVNPNTNQVVWEWHAWDHLIQDFNPNKANYGTVAQHPELIDLNWGSRDGTPDWLHSNAIDYNPRLDQILLCVPAFDEVWIIDHSTTTQEAAGHTGGQGGKGGDLLYRWGNPATYRAGTAADQKLFFPHDSNWADDFLDASHPHYGKLAVFNNRFNTKFSTVNVFNPNFDTLTWSYPTQGKKWLPNDFDLALTHPDTFEINSTGLSSVQLLPNENVLICSGRWGYAFELTPANEIVWEYKIPLKGGNPVAQGQVLTIVDNLAFRMNRYPVDFSGFSGKDLSAKGYIETNPDLALCERLTPVSTILNNNKWTIYPNPASNQLHIEWNNIREEVLQIFNPLGQRVATVTLRNGTHSLDITNWQKGLYFLRVGSAATKKLLLQ